MGLGHERSQTHVDLGLGESTALAEVKDPLGESHQSLQILFILPRKSHHKIELQYLCPILHAVKEPFHNKILG